MLLLIIEDRSVYTQNLWSFLDVMFILVYLVYLGLRIWGGVSGRGDLGQQALDVLAMGAPCASRATLACGSARAGERRVTGLGTDKVGGALGWCRCVLRVVGSLSKSRWVVVRLAAVGGLCGSPMPPGLSRGLEIWKHG